MTGHDVGSGALLGDPVLEVQKLSDGTENGIQPEDLRSSRKQAQNRAKSLEIRMPDENAALPTYRSLLAPWRSSSGAIGGAKTSQRVPDFRRPDGAGEWLGTRLLQRSRQRAV